MNSKGISCRVDYWRGHSENPATIARLATGFYSDSNTEQSAPLYGYRNAIRHLETGAMYLFSPHDPRMGNLSQFGGEAISALMSATGKGSAVSLAELHDDTFKCTRIDIAIDVHGERLTPEWAIKRIDGGMAKCSFKNVREVKAHMGESGHTVYCGGLESEKRIRIYDKAAETGLEGVWTRYEMCFSDAKAREVWATVKNFSTDAEMMSFARGLLASMLSFNSSPLWVRLMGVNSPYVWVETPRPESDNWAWLKSQVAPSFWSAHDRDGTWKYLDEFVKYVKELRAQ